MTSMPFSKNKKFYGFDLVGLGRIRSAEWGNGFNAKAQRNGDARLGKHRTLNIERRTSNGAGRMGSFSLPV